MAKELTPKQQRFVEEYLIDLNGKQAAIRSGYSPKTAEVQASRLLSIAKVAAAVADARKKLSDKLGITLERVQQEYARLAFLDIRKAFDADGRLKPIHELDDDTAAAIAGIEVEETRGPVEVDEQLEGQSHGGALKRNRGHEAGGRICKLKLSDKKGALDSITKLFGWVVEKKEITGKDGGPIVTQTKEQRDAAVAAALAADS